MKNFAITLITTLLTAITAQTQAQDQMPRSQMGEKVTITIDSIDSNIGYIMVTTMSADFVPIDFAMRPAKVGSIEFMLNKPTGNAPFSVMAYHDTNANRHLDLDSHNIPCEKSIVAHFYGDELDVSAALKNYSEILGKKRMNDSIKASTQSKRP